MELKGFREMDRWHRAVEGNWGFSVHISCFKRWVDLWNIFYFEPIVSGILRLEFLLILSNFGRILFVLFIRLDMRNQLVRFFNAFQIFFMLTRLFFLKGWSSDRWFWYLFAAFSRETSGTYWLSSPKLVDVQFSGHFSSLICFYGHVLLKDGSIDQKTGHSFFPCRSGFRHLYAFWSIVFTESIWIWR